MIKYYKSEEKKNDKEYEHFDTSDTSDTSNTSSLSDSAIAGIAIAILVIIGGALYIYINHRSLKGKKEIKTIELKKEIKTIELTKEQKQNNKDYLKINEFITAQQGRNGNQQPSYDRNGIHYVGVAGSRTI